MTRLFSTQKALLKLTYYREHFKFVALNLDFSLSPTHADPNIYSWKSEPRTLPPRESKTGIGR